MNKREWNKAVRRMQRELDRMSWLQCWRAIDEMKAYWATNWRDGDTPEFECGYGVC